MVEAGTATAQMPALNVNRTTKLHFTHWKPSLYLSVSSWTDEKLPMVFWSSRSWEQLWIAALNLSRVGKRPKPKATRWWQFSWLGNQQSLARGMEIESHPQGEQHHHPCPVMLWKWGDFEWCGIMRGAALPGVILAGRSQEGGETHRELLPWPTEHPDSPVPFPVAHSGLSRLSKCAWTFVLLFHLSPWIALNNNLKESHMARIVGLDSRTWVVSKRICTKTNPSKTPTFSLVLLIKVILPTVLSSSRGNQ